MRYILYIVVFSLALASCQSNGNGGEDPSGDTTTISDSRSLEDDSTVDYAQRSPRTHGCEVEGEVIEGNQFWARSENRLIVILADSTTYDENYGPSHRILEVYDADACSLIRREVLPVNVSPDFPYYLAEITYNNTSKIVAIRGFQSIYIYDVENDRLLPRLEPSYEKERYAVDAQSGMIQRLEVWENYLVGHAQAYGAFAFDLTDPRSPKPVEPFAEYELGEGDYRSLFLISDLRGQHQAIVPTYDPEADVFELNPVFQAPREVDMSQIDKTGNARFVALRLKRGQTVVYDLGKEKRIELPVALQQQSAERILEWVEENI
ncbi:MAG: hypothetical protein R3350_08930 [Saprospiraceae bacterium]|nr:hypothetical protein [Saprospiraceae bacterium]